MKWLRFRSTRDPHRYGVAHAMGSARMVPGMGMIPHSACGSVVPAHMESEAIEAADGDTRCKVCVRRTAT
jgi:hypothetical protein